MRLKAGAIGIVDLPNPKSMDIPWARATLARLNPVMSLADDKLLDVRGLRFSMRLNPEKADEILAPSGRSFASILAQADADQPLPKFPLNLNIRAHVEIKETG